MFQLFHRSVHRGGGSQSPRERRRTRLRVEEVEPRTLLSVYPLGPATVRDWYGFNTLSTTKGTNDGTGITIGIVDAFHDPNLFSDLDTFDNTYGLTATGQTLAQQYGPASSFLTQNFSQGTPTDPGWALETALDVEWAHAIAPGAKILLVEAPSNGLNDMLRAVDQAVNQGAQVLSMSWIVYNELSNEATYDKHFEPRKSNVVFVAASGDEGGVTGYPAISPDVVAVGGTVLTTSKKKGVTFISGETSWGGSGGGYSKYYTSQPSYQSNYAATNYLGNTVLNGHVRANPDVAYAAEGFAVYDTIPINGQSGWLTVGGTSAGAPQWSALIAIADQGRASGALTTASVQNELYTLASGSSTYLSNFRDITTGTAGSNSAVAGYDLVTGLGSPHADVLVPNLRNAPAVAAAQAGTTSTAVVTGNTEAVAVRPASSASEQVTFVLVAGSTGTTTPVVAPPAFTVATGTPAVTSSAAAFVPPARTVLSSHLSGGGSGDAILPAGDSYGDDTAPSIGVPDSGARPKVLPVMPAEEGTPTAAAFWGKASRAYFADESAVPVALDTAALAPLEATGDLGRRDAVKRWFRTQQ
jgi:subtilase family serine protease